MLQYNNLSNTVCKNLCSLAYLNNLDESSPDYKDAEGKKKKTFPHKLYYFLVQQKKKVILSKKFTFLNFSTAALVIVKEVANHANEIVRQEVIRNDQLCFEIVHSSLLMSSVD